MGLFEDRGPGGIFARPDGKSLSDRYPLMQYVSDLYGSDPSTHIPETGARGLVNAIFSGPDDPRLSQEENAGLKDRALRSLAQQVLQPQQSRRQQIGDRIANAGLAMASMSGRGHDSASFTQQLGAGIGAYRGTMDSQRLQQAYAQIIQQYGQSPQAVSAIAELALANGDRETAHEAAYTLSVMQQGQRGGGASGYNLQRIEYVTPDAPDQPKFGVFDPRQGVVFDMSGQPVPNAQPAPTSSGGSQVSLQRVEYKDAEGSERVGTFNPRTGVIAPIEGVTPSGGKAMSQDQAKASSYVGLLPPQMDTLDRFSRAPTPAEVVADQFALGNYAKSEEYQKVNVAGLTLADAYLRMTTGAAYSETELAATRNMLIPTLGDTPGTIAYKAALRRQVLNMIRVRAGLEPLPLSEKDMRAMRGDSEAQETEGDKVDAIRQRLEGEED